VVNLIAGENMVKGGTAAGDRVDLKKMVVGS